MKFLLFGTGDYYERYKKWFSAADVLALLDNDESKQNTYIDEIRVLSPEEGIKLPYDVVIILSFYVKEMRAQLIGLGAAENRIFHFYDLHDLIYRKEIRKSVMYYGGARERVESKERKGKKILLLSTDLALGGPAIALFHGAKTLSRYGWQVVFGSMLDGPLREMLLAENIPVIVDPNLQIETMKESGWTSSFSLIFCNAINYYVFLSQRDVRIPTIWWLHDSSFFYDGVNKTVLRNLDLTNLKIFSVGPVPREAIQTIVPDIETENLIYGVEECQKRRIEKEEQNEKVRFVTIGYIEWRKGQDILLKAIRRLPEKVRKQSDFCLVGQNTSLMAGHLKREIESMPEVRMTGTMGREGIEGILNGADVLICPSREDPMPTVAAEAMMYGVLCIVSDAAGTAAYIQNGVNGFIFQKENDEELSDKMRWCVEHKKELGDMGKRSRKIFDQQFSMEVFNKNLIKIIEEAMKSSDIIV